MLLCCSPLFWAAAAAAACLRSRDGKVTGVRLNNGRVLAADRVIVGIGAVPTIPEIKSSKPLQQGKRGGLSVDPFLRSDFSVCLSFLRLPPSLRSSRRRLLISFCMCPFLPMRLLASGLVRLCLGGSRPPALHSNVSPCLRCCCSPHCSSSSRQ